MFSLAFWSILGVDSSRIESSGCMCVSLSVLARNCFVCSGRRFSRNFEDYITVDHAVDRSLLLSRLCGGTYVRGGTEFTVVNLVCDSSRTVGCVGESDIDEPLVGTVILPQIGELPVRLSIGAV